MPRLLSVWCNLPFAAAGARLLEVVNLLRKRPSLKPSGLLWKLQASLAEAVTEQERLKGEVASLQEELQALRSSSTAGLERCGERIDAVEESAAAALVAAAAASEAAAAAAHGQVPGTPVAEIKVLEGRVATIDERVAAIDERVATIDERVAAIDEQVAASTRRISALEEAQELSSSAARLVRASSSGSSADTLAALQSHLLVQQQKLQAQMEALGAGIRQAVPGQVSEAVGGAASEIGRRLSERLATKQDVQALSVKVNSKVSREDVERMLRSHKVAMAPPPAAAPAADPNCPAAGMRFRCLSCDTALQPFAFAVAPGNGGASGSAGQAHTADLRYTQLPVASPARNAAQPWTAAVASGLEPAAAGLAGGLAGGEPSPSRLSVASGPAADVPAVQVPAVQPPSPRGSRPSTSAASRLGSPARCAAAGAVMR
ncbi:hypothetical protein COHA_006169 [Chlorella ohadii]|uniref:Uncharacterized protein n=1 Tax=Chlorella ohadii TaxID=2649997 RepID=A0AAD5DLQ1_9CHLO|nr:hypothetical protein COHA_006169 [Chlorella ohadii]